jgi:hypothetical protein
MDAGRSCGPTEVAGEAAADARLLARLVAAAGRVLSRDVDDRPAGRNRWADGSFDLIHVGGERSGRLEFALESWRLLEQGGRLILADIVGHADIAMVVAFALSRFREIERIEFGPEGSSLAIVHKCAPKAYTNWNRSERRASWQVGDKDLETTLRHLRGGG